MLANPFDAGGSRRQMGGCAWQSHRSGGSRCFQLSRLPHSCRNVDGLRIGEDCSLRSMLGHLKHAESSEFDIVELALWDRKGKDSESEATATRDAL